MTGEDVYRQLHRMLDLAGISGVTPQMFRGTVATAIDEQASVGFAAELLSCSGMLTRGLRSSAAIAATR